MLPTHAGALMPHLLPAGGDAIGWFEPINGDPDFGVAAHANSGTADCNSSAPGSPVVHLYAGMVGWTGETLVWSISSWVPAAGGASPYIIESLNGWTHIQWENTAGGAPPVGSASIGTLVLTASIDGVPIEVGQRLVAVTSPPTGDYATIAWGPE
jgi:hypothetical protein